MTEKPVQLQIDEINRKLDIILDDISVQRQNREVLNDLAKDLAPIIKQIGLDGIQKFHELEQKGYIEITKQVGKTMDTIISRYNIEEIESLSDNLVRVGDTLLAVTNPGVLNKINTAVVALNNINPDEIEEYSVWRLMKQLKKPEVRKSIGFIMAFLQNISKQNKNKQLINN